MWKIIDGSERKIKQKQIPIIPWNRIWDTHAQKGMKVFKGVTPQSDVKIS